jgi:hypothetical protein
MTDKKDSTTARVNSMAMPDNSGADDYREKVDTKPKKLKLDSNSYKPAKTRQQLYNELKQEEEILDQDVFQYASYVERGIALALDILFVFLLYKIVIFITPYEFKLAQYCMDKYGVEFMLGNGFLLRMILILTAIVAAFVGVIMPLAFFNNSFGKKFLNLKVRGDEKYTLSINEAITREFIAKPVSIACIAGFILPFYNKERKSLHDRIMKTFVIKG